MRNTKEIESLIKLGLTEREAKVYLVLLGSKKMSAAALTKYAGISRTKIYEVLVSLENKGFCKEVDSNSNRKEYLAIDPRIVLNGIVEKEEERLYSLRVKNQGLVTFLSKIYKNSADRLSNYDFIEVLKGRSEIAAKYSELRSNIETELLEFMKGPYAMTNFDIEAESEFTRELIGKGVKIQVLYEADETISNEVVAKAIKTNIEIGVEYCTLPYVPIKMSLFDRHTIMLTLDDPVDIESQFTSLVIRDKNLYSVLKQSFQMYWTQAKPM